MIYTFYWRDGEKDKFDGETPEDALNNAGYGGGAVAALDFYSEGDNSDYEWSSETLCWVKNKVLP